MGWSICEEMGGIYSSLRDSNLWEIGFLILVQLFFVLEYILYLWCYPVIHPRVLLVRESLSLPDPDVLSCKSLFYRRVIVIWIGIYLWGIKSPPRKYVRIFMSECIMMTVVGRRYMRNAEEVMWVEWGGQPHPLMLLTLGTETRTRLLHLVVPAGLSYLK